MERTRWTLRFESVESKGRDEHLLLLRNKLFMRARDGWVVIGVQCKDRQGMGWSIVATTRKVNGLPPLEPLLSCDLTTCFPSLPPLPNSSSTVLMSLPCGHVCNGKRFLIPQGLQANSLDDEDMENDLQRYALLFSEVQSILRTARNGQNPTIFMLDCCRSNGLLPRSADRSADLGLDNFTAPGNYLVNSCIVFSTQSGQVALDGDPGRGGPFMSAFAEKIRVEGKSLEDVLTDMRGSLMAQTKMIQMAPSYSVLTKPFYFNPC